MESIEPELEDAVDVGERLSALAAFRAAVHIGAVRADTHGVITYVETADLGEREELEATRLALALLVGTGAVAAHTATNSTVDWRAVVDLPDPAAYSFTVLPATSASPSARPVEVLEAYEHAAFEELLAGAPAMDGALASSPSVEPAGSLTQGSEVRHHTFGLGVVLAVDEDANTVTVRFGDGAGVKLLRISYARLEVVAAPS